MTTPIKLVSSTRPARRIFMDGGRKSHGHEIAGTLKSTNVDGGFSPTTTLRPGNVLCKGADGLWYDDLSGGVASAGAYVLSAEAPDADWQNKILTFKLDGLTVGTVTLGAADDTIAEVVTAVNAVEEIRSIFTASDNGSDDLLRITCNLVGKAHHIEVTCDLSTAFGASGQNARGTDADWAVLRDYVSMLDGNQVASDMQGVTLVRRGHFDESELIWAGAATLPQDFVRIMLQRGAEFSS